MTPVSGVTEKPILFTAEMVRAILRDENSKIQTRRVVKPQPGGNNRIPVKGEKGIVVNIRDPRAVEQCPYGKPGDRLWVRETWGVAPCFNNLKPSLIPLDSWRHVDYRADHERYHNVHVDKWRPSIHMPRWASRILLRVTDIRVERVQDMSGEDAIAEGWPRHLNLFPTVNAGSKALGWFERLWDSLNEKRGFEWDKNPWVWAVTFERVKGDNAG